MSKASTKRRNRKRTLYVAQGGLCWLCGGKMDLYFGPGRCPPNAASFDHVLPKSQGGKDGFHNLQLAHQRCNELRGNRADVRAIDRAETYQEVIFQ